MGVIRRQAYALLGLFIWSAALLLPIIQLAGSGWPADGVGIQPYPQGDLLVLIAATLAAGTMWWLKARIELIPIYLVTYFHELGHGTTAAMLGGSPEKLAMNTDGSGSLSHRSRFGRIRIASVSFAGYPFPAVASFAAAQLQIAGLTTLWLGLITISAIFIAVTTARNLWSLLVCAILASLSALTITVGSNSLSSVFTGLTIGILIRGGYESAEAHSEATKPHTYQLGNPSHNDADQLSALVGGRPSSWARLQLVLTVLVSSATGMTLVLAVAGASGALN